MSRIHVTVLLALSALALPASMAFAQVFQGTQNQADQSIQGGLKAGAQTCQQGGGGSRARTNCDPGQATTTVRTEQELKISIPAPQLTNTQCSATTTTEYQQLNTIARVNSTIAVADCTAASGTLTMALRLRDESGEDKPLEFSETWQRSDNQNVKFTADYPIGENMELRSVRVRGLRCTCADAPKEDVAAGESAVTLEQPLAEK